MKITLAFVQDDGAEWLVSSYDENTLEEWSGVVPTYHLEAIASLGDGAVVRECTVEVPDRFVKGLFATPELPVTDWQPVEEEPTS